MPRLPSLRRHGYCCCLCYKNSTPPASNTTRSITNVARQQWQHIDRTPSKSGHGKPFSSAKYSRTAMTLENTTTQSTLNSLDESQWLFGPPASAKTCPPDSNIRQELRAWQLKYNTELLERMSPFRGQLVDPSLALDPRGAEKVDNLDDQENDWALQPESTTVSERDPGTLDPQHRLLRRGDLVELNNAVVDSDPIMAVYVRRLGLGAHKAQFFTLTGKWLHGSELSVHFAVPGYVDVDAVDRLIPHLPNDPSSNSIEVGRLNDVSVPRSISSPIISRLRHFVQQRDELYRNNARRFDQAFDIVALQTDLRYGPLPAIARQLLQLPPGTTVGPVELSATRLALARTALGFGYDYANHRFTQSVTIRSKNQVTSLTKVTKWLRQYKTELSDRRSSSDHPSLSYQTEGGRIIHKFAEKARTAVIESRRHRAWTALGLPGPSAERFDISANSDSKAYKIQQGEAWDHNEQDILRYLHSYSLGRAIAVADGHKAQPSTLLNAIGMYGDLELTSRTTLAFLSEIGYCSPWESLFRYDENLLLPGSGHSTVLDQLTDKLHQYTETSVAKCLRPDILEHMRTTVRRTTFCIDSASTLDVDDGISIERDPTDGRSWVHVHVADPAAVIDHKSALARLARHLTESVYTPETNFSMFPAWVAEHHCSLNPGRPCLTFSAKINDDGEIMDYKISPRRIGRVVHIETEEIDKALGIQENQTLKPSKTLQVGGTPPNGVYQSPKRITRAVDLSNQEKADLRELLPIVQRRRVYKRSRGLLVAERRKVFVETWAESKQAGIPHEPLSLTHVRRFIGDPIIQLHYSEFDIHEKSLRPACASDVVSECMLLAGEVAGRWLQDRRIPAMFRGSLPFASESAVETSEQYSARVIQPRFAQGKELPHHLLNRYLSLSPPTTLLTEAAHHRHLAIDHFVRVTSPLRRFPDLLAHWQIEAALLEEEESGKSLVGGGIRDGVLPFSRENVANMLPMTHAREDMVRKAKRRSTNFWITMLLFRAYYFKEAELPKTFKAYISQEGNGTSASSCMLLELSHFAYMNAPKIGGVESVQLGDIYEVQIVTIAPHNGRVYVEALRKLSRFEDGEFKDCTGQS